VVVDPESLPGCADEFREALARSLRAWMDEGLKVVWLEIPIDKSALIPLAVDAGFVFHHGEHNYVMLTYRLQKGAFVPPYATHYVGAGGVVLNERQELLVVWERVHRMHGRRYYKLPGGALHRAEHLVDGVIREVQEETGVLTRFESLVCFRHWHGYRFNGSDIYFVCRLSPLTQEITIQQEEIQECLWMPVGAYLASEHVGVFNKRIVQAALDTDCHLVPVTIEGYESEQREVFLPKTAMVDPSRDA
jgi:8-oxo-dGTP diphosphatase